MTLCEASLLFDPWFKVGNTFDVSILHKVLEHTLENIHLNYVQCTIRQKIAILHINTHRKLSRNLSTSNCSPKTKTE
jgi:hypothetical protein